MLGNLGQLERETEELLAENMRLRDEQVRLLEQLRADAVLPGHHRDYRLSPSGTDRNQHAQFHIR